MGSSNQVADQSSGPSLTIAVTPGGAFAFTAFAVASLALAVAWGRRHPLESTSSKPSPADKITTLEQIQQGSTVSYTELAVDRGLP